MGRTWVRQDTQVRNSDVYTDSTAPTEAAYETNPTHIETDLNNLRSQVHNLLKVQAGNWWDDLNVPSSLETGTKRGVNDINTDLHALEKKRRLRRVCLIQDITVTAAQNWEILGAGEIPTQTTAAVGAVTTLGTVVAAHGGTFGTHSLAEVTGSNALNPKNLLTITDGGGDPILSSGRRVWGLLHGESGLTDGTTITITTDTRVQISFVRPNAAHTDLEACPVGDIASSTVRYCYTERVKSEDLNEQDYLSNAFIDIGAGSVAVTRQTAYDNQAATAVDVTTNSILDLEGAGLYWEIRDDGENTIFRVTEGDAGGTGVVQIAGGADTFDVDAGTNDFLNGASFDTGAAGTTIDIGATTANTITSGGALTLTGTGANDVRMVSTQELVLDDSYRSGGGWSLNGIRLSDSSAEWTTFETNFGEVSLLNAINQARAESGRVKGVAIVQSQVTENNDVGSTTGGNLDVDLPDYSSVTFVDDVDVFLNGVLLRNGADLNADHDVYPGSTPANGTLRFEFKVKANDVITLIVE